MNNYGTILQALGGMISDNNKTLERLYQSFRVPFGVIGPNRNARNVGFSMAPNADQRRVNAMVRGQGGRSATMEERPARRRTVKPGKSEGKRKTLDVLLDPSKYTASQLSREDLNHIIGLYGSSVENIYELGAGQRWMLEEGARSKNAFFLQILTKAVIPFDPAAFRQRADEVAQGHESLRSAFVMRGVEQPYRVVLKDRHPEINCFDLSDLDMESFDEKIRKQMETDRLRGFDLERDSPLRISVYKSCEKDTYAIIVSQPHINSDGTSLGILFADLFIGYSLDMNGIDKKLETFSYQSYAEHLNQVDVEKELEFWKKSLGGMEEDQLLPGQQESALDYEGESVFVPFEEKELSILKKARRAFGVTQFTLLQGLWGLMAAKLKGRDHIVFGVITSGRDAGVSDSMRLAGGFINALPIQVSYAPDETLADFFKGLQRSFLQAMENSHCSPGQIREALGRKNDVFSHILNNHNFAKPKSSGFSEGGFSGIRFIGGDVYDNLSADLCVYFTTLDDRQGCNYSYNSRAFSKEVIELLAEDYKRMIAALESVTEGMSVGMLPELDSEMFNTIANVKRIEQIKIAGSLKKLPAFRDGEDDELISLAASCRMKHYTSDEIIIKRKERLNEVPILLQGRVICFGETRDGWCNPLNVKSAGSILDYSAFFEDERTANLVSNGSGESLVLYIPEAALLDYFYNHTEAAVEFMRQLYDERNRFMKLWTSVE